MADGIAKGGNGDEDSSASRLNMYNRKLLDKNKYLNPKKLALLLEIGQRISDHALNKMECSW